MALSINILLLGVIDFLPINIYLFSIRQQQQIVTTAVWFKVETLLFLNSVVSVQLKNVLMLCVEDQPCLDCPLNYASPDCSDYPGHFATLVFKAKLFMFFKTETVTLIFHDLWFAWEPSASGTVALK